MKNIVFLIFTTFGLFSSIVSANSQLQAVPSYVDYAKARVESAIKSSTSWDGPVTGPKIVNNKTVIFVASDLRNGGVNAVAKGVSEAVSHTNWNLRFLDGLGSEVRQGAAIRKAVGFQPDAIVLCGIDARRHADVLLVAKKLGITVVGWHVIDEAKSDESLGLFTNITTNPIEVAEVASLLAVAQSNGQAKVVVFTDPNYSIALLKSNAMIENINKCDGCQILNIREVPLDETAKRMPDVVEELLKQYPNQITHFLAINDLYFDFGTPSLESVHERKEQIPQSISAGDGSKAAYKRINTGLYQLATVPEPLHMQGWQIVDELNRAFNHLKPSGYSAPVHLVTDKNVQELIGKGKVDIYDPDNGYRHAYLTIWNK
ncbi:substrate-binding domain-containing protein [Vibrio viridaestus]|uniref:Autoinducer 2-binding periplasmic protein LuxP n=1 Tax=Vibrio viridaestus TaxID=2487322 RepID=A0A3N9TKE9_9VIBR|nr:substrate-binding domain-containing protein [Vibrio viridaestus]RQW64868.1 sugar ABC transporter substrate-binding protein [Vibrio viridaestus]